MCDFVTKVQNEPVEKKNSSLKIGQKSQHPIRSYNIDHFFRFFLHQIPPIISTKKKYIFCAYNRDQHFDQKIEKM